MDKNKTVLSICAKCSDLYSHVLKRKDGKEVEYSGYVPSFMPGEHYGDYIMLDIDVYTGKILNWKKWKKGKAKNIKAKSMPKYTDFCKFLNLKDNDETRDLYYKTAEKLDGAK